MWNSINNYWRIQSAWDLNDLKISLVFTTSIVNCFLIIYHIVNFDSRFSMFVKRRSTSTIDLNFSILKWFKSIINQFEKTRNDIFFVVEKSKQSQSTNVNSKKLNMFTTFSHVRLFIEHFLSKNRSFEFKNQKNSTIFIKSTINTHKKLVFVKSSVNLLIIDHVNILEKFKFIISKEQFIKFKNQTFVTLAIKINKELVFVESCVSLSIVKILEKFKFIISKSRINSNKAVLSSITKVKTIKFSFVSKLSLASKFFVFKFSSIFKYSLLFKVFPAFKVFFVFKISLVFKVSLALKVSLVFKFLVYKFLVYKFLVYKFLVFKFLDFKDINDVEIEYEKIFSNDFKMIKTLENNFLCDWYTIIQFLSAQYLESLYFSKKKLQRVFNAKSLKYVKNFDTNNKNNFEIDQIIDVLYIWSKKRNINLRFVCFLLDKTLLISLSFDSRLTTIIWVHNDDNWKSSNFIEYFSRLKNCLENIDFNDNYIFDINSNAK